MSGGLAQRLGLAAPIVQAPMAGGPATPELVGAVCNAGGLGFLAAGYQSPRGLSSAIDRTRQLTNRPFGVNLFVPSPPTADGASLAAFRAALAADEAVLRVSAGDARWSDDGWEEKLAVIERHRPAVVSFTFGLPEQEVLTRLRGLDVLTMVTITNDAEALRAAERDPDALIVQGPLAGGHRATFNPLAAPSTTPLLDLLDDLKSRLPQPLIATGGLMERADVEAVLAHGATAAQAGTAFLLATEAGTKPVHRAALSGLAERGTVVTKAFSGRYARGIRNRFTDEHPDAPLAYPEVHFLTAPLRAAAAEAMDAERFNLWAGARYEHAVASPAATIVRTLAPTSGRSH